MILHSIRYAMLQPRHRLAVALRQHASSLFTGRFQSLFTRNTTPSLSIPSFPIAYERRLFGTTHIPVNDNNESRPRGRSPAGSGGPAPPRLSSQEVIKHLNSESSLLKREEYLHNLTATQGVIPRHGRLHVSPQLIDALLPLIETSSSPLDLLKTIQSCGECLLLDKKSKDGDRLVASVLNAISGVVDSARMHRVLWSKSEAVSRSLLALRKMNMKIDALPVMEKNVTLDLIDKGFCFHVEDAQQPADIFTFTNLLHGAARLGIHWEMLLPSTQEAIQESIEFYGSRQLKNHQQAAMLLTGLGEMQFPLKTAAGSQQRVVLRWSFDTIDKVISYMAPMHKRKTSQKVPSSSSRGTKAAHRDAFASVHTPETAAPEVISQSVAGVIFGLKEMDASKSGLSMEQRKLMAFGLGITCKHMPDVLLCQSLHSLGAMDIEWKLFAKEWQTVLLDTIFTRTLERTTLQHVCLLLEGLSMIGVDMYDVARAQHRMDVVDRCVQRVLAMDAHLQGGAHFAKSRNFARLLRALGLHHFCWTDFSIRTQQVLLGGFRLSFDFFTPRDLVHAIRGYVLCAVVLCLLYLRCVMSRTLTLTEFFVVASLVAWAC